MFEAIRGWVRHKRNNEYTWSVMLCAGFALLAVVAFCAQFLFFYLVLGNVLQSLFEFSNASCAVIALLIVLVTVVLDLRRRSGDWTELLFEGSRARSSDEADVKAVLNPVTTEEQQRRMALRTVVTLLCLGSVMGRTARSCWQRAARVRVWDIDELAAVLTWCVRSPARVPYDELSAQFPRLNLSRVRHQLEDVEGVIFVLTPPPGIALAESLRAELEIFIPEIRN